MFESNNISEDKIEWSNTEIHESLVVCVIENNLSFIEFNSIKGCQ